MATKILLWDTSQSVYLFILLTSVMMSVASGVDLKEWKTLHLQRVSQQDDGKSLLLEPGELTSWRGDTPAPAGETRDSKSWAGVNNHQPASQAHTPASTPQQIYSSFKILV